MRHSLALALALLAAADPALAQPLLEYLDSGQWTFNEDVAVQGSRAATTMAYGVQIWDLADPADPILLGDYYTDGNRAYAVDWEGDLVAATSSVGHLYLIDVGDPAHPARIDRLTGLGSSTDIALVRDGATRWCYSAGNAGNSLQVRDLTNPAAADLRGGLHLDGTPTALAVLGDVALVSARTVGLYAVDLSNPDAPTLVDTETLAGTQVGIAADGTRAAVASSAAGFTLFDVTNPANPVKRATVIPAAGAWSNLSVSEVVLHGTTLWAVCQDAGAIAYDITNLNAPVRIGYDPRLDIDPPVPPYYVFNEGVYADGRLYLSQWNGFTPGCIVLDATSSGMDYLGRALGFDYVRDVDEDAGFVYGCTGQMGVFAHEHVSLTQLVPRGQLHVPETWGVQAHGSLVYVASTTHGLVVGDFSDPDHPVELDGVALGQARQLTVADGVAYVVAFSQGFHTVDVSNPNNLVELDEVVRANMQSVNIDKVGDLVVTADRADGMNLWDVSDPADIQHLANWATPNQALDVVLSPDGDYAYLVVTGTGVQVIDVSTPASPDLLGSFASGATGLVLEDGILHVSTGGAGVTSYEQADSPAAPVELASFNTAHDAKSLCARSGDDGHFVYVADYSAVVALRLDTSVPVAVSSFAIGETEGGVLVEWRLGEPMLEENLRLVAAPAAGGAEATVPIAPQGAGGQAWQGFDSRAALVAGSAWRYSLYGREPGGNWELLRSDTLVIGGAPEAAIALRAWPNPFNPSTRLDFALPAAGRARLAIFDVAGRRLALLHEGPLPAGPARFDWDGRDTEGRSLPSGVYLARLETAGQARQLKLVMLR